MTSRAVNKDVRSKSKISDNFGHNNLAFLMFHQILLSLQWNEAQLLVITMVYLSFLTNCRTIWDPGFYDISKYQQNLNLHWTVTDYSTKLSKNRSWNSPVLCYFTVKLEFVSNILSINFSKNKFLILTCPITL